MLRSLRRRLGASAAAFGRAFANPDLRRLQLAHAGSQVGTWSYGIALLVWAFGVGGPTAVGLIALARYVPAAVASPLTSFLGDRYPRVRVMIASDLVRLATMIGMAATVAFDGPPAVVYVLAAITSVTATAFGPAKSAILPSLARTPDELTAANVASSTIESVAIFAGPALGGILVATGGPEVAFLVNAATFVWSALLLVRIGGGREAPPERTELGARAAGTLVELTAGVREIARRPAVRIVVLLTGVQTLVFGALTVLVVVLALEMLDLGEAGVGFLNSALGVGGLVGALGAFALIGRPRLGGGFGLGIALWGLPIALVGIWPGTVLALVLLGVVGAANTLVDVAGQTLLQRTADEAVLARVFGVLEGMIYLGIAVGGLLAPALIALIGNRGALVAFGLLLPAVALVSAPALRRIDAVATAPGRGLELLREIPMFAPLAAQTLEHLAARLVSLRVAAGTEIVRAGDSGDRFYVVAAGEVEVDVDGRAGEPLGPGGYFGEIALLRDVPRTATVRARTSVELYALDRDDFIQAVTGHPESATAADVVVGRRLGGMQAATA